MIDVILVCRRRPLSVDTDINVVKARGGGGAWVEVGEDWEEWGTSISEAHVCFLKIKSI